MRAAALVAVAVVALVAGGCGGAGTAAPTSSTVSTVSTTTSAPATVTSTTAAAPAVSTTAVPASAVSTTAVPASTSATTRTAAPATSPKSTTPKSTTTKPTVAKPTTTTRALRHLDGLAGAVIAVDPGHNEANGRHPSEINRQVDAGGFKKACDTTGTQTNAGYTESAYTFDVATRLTTVLRAAGATVVLTRENNDGVGPCVDERAAVGNRANADAAVSVHADGGPSGGRGFHVIEPALVKGYTEPIVEPSARLGRALRDAFRDGTGMPTATYLARDGIDVRGDLGGLNLSQVPKVFIETGNMRNATDAALLGDANFRQRAAEAIAAGIDAFLAGT